MGERIFYLRSRTSGRFEKNNINPENINLILYYTLDKQSYAYCPVHHEWEKIAEAEVGSRFIDDWIKTECGTQQSGHSVCYMPTPEIPFEFRYIPNKYLRRFLVWNDPVFADVIGLGIKMDLTNSVPLVIEYFCLDRKRIENRDVKFSKIPIVKVQRCYQWNASGSGKVKPYVTYNAMEYFRDDIPNEIADKIKSELVKYIKSEYGVDHTFYNAGSGKKTIAALIAFPYEPRLYEISGSVSEVALVSSSDKNAFWTLCEKMGLKYLDCLRESFYHDPFTICYYRNILDCGFTDRMLIEDILESRLCRRIFHDRNYDVFFYIKHALNYVGQNELWSHIIAAINQFESSGDNAKDALPEEFEASMSDFYMYNSDLPDEMKNQLYTECFTPKNCMLLTQYLEEHTWHIVLD